MWKIMGMCIYLCERESERLRETERHRQKRAETEVSDECYFILFGYIKNKI